MADDNGKKLTMCAARINIKNIDYFKFKKLVIDANRDDYNSSSREVKTLCDSVQVRSCCFYNGELTPESFFFFFLKPSPFFFFLKPARKQALKQTDPCKVHKWLTFERPISTTKNT